MALACLLLVIHTAAAAPAATISGHVADSHGRSISGAEVLVQSETSGSRWRVQTDEEGSYSVSGLEAGRYKVTARMPGLRTVSRLGADLDPGRGLSIDFVMEPLALHEVVTVVSADDRVDPSGGGSLLVTRGSPGATLPANGGDYRVLFDLMPGVVITPASTGDAGQFTSNGQRPNGNSFRVDGISANTGVGSSILPGAFPGASLPAMTAIGTTENLVSNETAQAVELRPSDFLPEYGERPGAEALVTTRSGSNEIHSEFFERVRDNGWNARDWFANSHDLPFTRPYYRRLGGVVGGAIRRNSTFFFLSAEGSNLTDTGLQLTSVPSLAARMNAPDPLKPILNYYPLPTGPDFGDGEAEGLVQVQTSAMVLNSSLRIDQALGRWGNLFARAVESPSRTSLNRFNWASITLGLTAGHSHGATHDLRLNYSRADLKSVFGGGPGFTEAAFGVAGLLPGFAVLGNGLIQFSLPAAGLTNLLPPLQNSQTILGLSVPGLGQFVSYGAGLARQDQWELRDSFLKNSGPHQFRAGVDALRLEPSRNLGTYAVLGAAPSLESLVQGDPLAVTVSSPAERGGRAYVVSLFGQDTFHLTDRFSLVYGARWEITPPQSAEAQIPTVSGLWSAQRWQTVQTAVVNGTAPWPVRYGQIAPRIGLAYRLSQSGLVVRAGAGLFYDATVGTAVSAINGAPFNSWQLSAGGTGIDSSGRPVGAGLLTSQDSSAPDVRRFVSGSYPALRLPASYEWKLSLEKTIRPGGVVSAGYVGSTGRNLLGHEAYIDPATGILGRLVTLTANSSSYEALQLRYSGTVAPNVFLSAGFTWSHSIDDGSQDSSVFLVHPGYRLAEARGSSSFDVRHALTAALSYRVPRSRRVPIWAADWNFSTTFRGRTGFPIDIRDAEQALGQGFDNVGRPDLIPNVPVWIADPSVAGHRRLNPAAFQLAGGRMEGTLGRNAIAGNGLRQVDISLRREFPVISRLSFEVGLSVFNVLNHPAFADPVPFLSSPWFGQSTSMQNLMLGSGSPNTGLPPLFQSGGARSAEFSLRVLF